jgi:hypothetical protein
MVRLARRWAAGLAVLALAYTFPAEAGQQVVYGGVGQRYGVTYGAPSPASFALPGNVASFTAWWGLRAYSASHCTGAVKAVQIRRASDNALLDVLIGTDCNIAIAPAVAHCAATTCTVRTFYDQVAGNACGGASCDLLQTTDANQPAFTFNCNGTKPCIQSAATAQTLTSANSHTPAGATGTLYYVGRRSVGTGATVMLAQTAGAGNRIQGTSAASTWSSLGASGISTLAATENTFHVAMSVNTPTGASAFIAIDGGQTGGTTVGGTVAGVPSGFRGGTSTTTSSFEGGFVDNAIVPLTSRTALSSLARGYYGF